MVQTGLETRLAPINARTPIMSPIIAPVNKPKDRMLGAKSRIDLEPTIWRTEPSMRTTPPTKINALASERRGA